MVERREGTSTEGRGLGHSFGFDNMERGEDGVDFKKRRPTYPIGDNPRGREIDFQASDLNEAYGSTRNPVFRAYRGRAPLEGQKFEDPQRIGQLQKPSQLRPQLPPRTVDTAALDAAKEIERAALAASDFGRLFPSVSISAPAGGSNVARGTQLYIEAPATDLRNLQAATLYIDSQAVDRRVLPRGDQDGTPKDFRFQFYYSVPSDRALGSMTVSVHVFNISSAAQGMIADDALNAPPLTDGTRTGLPSIKNDRKHQATSSLAYQPQNDETGLLRTPEGIATLTVNVV
jgi:hypothetical protein